MVVTDPIADMLVRIKNAGTAGKHIVDVPHSDIKLRIANVLIKEGFVEYATKKIKKIGNRQVRVIEIGLKSQAGAPFIRGIERVSRSSVRVYMGAADLRPVKNGYGIMVVSTPKGIMSDSQARKEHVGGEVICKVW
ncbi:MAG TPA: 30S ribosomal protein S8 [Candidatus Paceibacterota bacterium]|nr:30S ribosomal protein S8 [Candidatus Paceibacterota bacterium]